MGYMRYPTLLVLGVAGAVGALLREVVEEARQGAKRAVAERLLPGASVRAVVGAGGAVHHRGTLLST